MKNILIILVMLVCMPAANAAYRETMDPKGLTKNLTTDFKMVDDNGKSDQSEKLQEAIDKVAKKGGGRLILRKGTYSFSGINLKSNVHLLIEKDTVLKPYWPKGTKTIMFSLDSEEPEKYIENVSIRGLGGRYTVDYSDRGKKSGEGIRFAVCRLVKNFLIADANIQDSHTTYCGIILVPAKGKRADQWKISRATDGTIRDCSIFNADSGYGLAQLHGARNILFENLYALGGVTLRLESGAGGEYAGVFDITGRNIAGENCRSAVMFSPHATHNGTVHVDGVTAKSCGYAVRIGSGFIDRKHKDDPDAQIGTYASDSTIKNIHAVFGMNAQIDKKEIYQLEPEYYDDIRKSEDNEKSVVGPSIAAVYDGTKGAYKVTVENVTSEGFKYHQNTVVTEADFSAREKNKWNIVKSIPACAEKPKSPGKKGKKSK